MSKSVEPSSAGPRLPYAAARTRTAFEVAGVAPFELPAQTRQATSFPRSATPSRRELSWRRVITLSLRSQRKEKTMGFVPAHDPGRHVRTWPDDRRSLERGPANDVGA